MLKFAILLVLIHTCAGSGTYLAELGKDVLEDLYNIYAKKPLRERDLNLIVDPKKIKYYLFSNNNAENFTIIDSSNATTLNKNALTVLLLHGWLEDRTTAWYRSVTESFFELNPQTNVIQIDYSPYSKIVYPASVLAASEIGVIVGKFVATLIEKYSIPIENVLPVGLSLGGQISGLISREVKEKIGKKLHRIIALDPAGPSYQDRPKSGKLNKDDADIVEVIHTNGGVFGYLGSCGSIDFFPNGGSIQPGCATKFLTDITQLSSAVTCHHTRSTELLAFALKNKKHFKARKCSQWLTYSFMPNQCPNNFVYLGDIETEATGDYYLKTTSSAPYYDD